MADELDARVREAYRMTAAPVAVDSYELATAVVVLRGALIHERAMRLKAEWERDHRCSHSENWGGNPWYSHCADPCHDWTDDDWRRSVDELLKPN